MNWRTGASSLEVDASLTARDAEHVYAFGARVRHADPVRFRALGADYWTDDRRVWTGAGEAAGRFGGDGELPRGRARETRPVALGFGDATDRLTPLPTERAGRPPRRPRGLDGLLRRAGGPRTPGGGDAPATPHPDPIRLRGATPLARARSRRDNHPCTRRPFPPETPPPTPLRRGWTTGACAAAGARAAIERLLTGTCPASVAIALPGGARPVFAVAHEAHGDGWAEAGIVKDARRRSRRHPRRPGDRARRTGDRPGPACASPPGKGSARSPAPACRCRRASRPSTPGPARDDRRRAARGRRARRPHGDGIRARRRQARRAHAERPARHPRRPVDPGDDGASSSRSPAPPGSTRSTAASTSRAPAASPTSWAPPAPLRRRRRGRSTACRSRR